MCGGGIGGGGGGGEESALSHSTTLDAIQKGVVRQRVGEWASERASEEEMLLACRRQ